MMVYLPIQNLHGKHSPRGGHDPRGGRAPRGIRDFRKLNLPAATVYSQMSSAKQSTGQRAAEQLAEQLAELEGFEALGQVFARAVNAVAGPVTGPVASRPPPSYVVDRHGRQIRVLFDMITARNAALCEDPMYGPPLRSIDAPSVTADVVRRFRNGMTTRELDAETAGVCVARGTHNADYEWLAARICASDLAKRVPACMDELVSAIVAAAPNRDSIRYSDEFIAVVRRAGAAIDVALDPARDYRLRFFGWQTLARGYLMRPASRVEKSSLLDEQLMERPQHFYMRAALGIFVCQPDGRGHEAPADVFARRLALAFRFYNALSLHLVSNATPTMLNAGTGVAQLSSCFQLATGDDLAALFATVSVAALTSKWSGGVSLWIHNVRAEGAPIRKTGGLSSGIGPYLEILNKVQVYVDQGGNRPGAFAVYLSVDHDDIFTFLSMARLKGDEALRGRSAADLKYAMWVSDLFMETLAAQIANDAAVAAGGAGDPTAGDWYLFSPDTAPGLHLAYGDEYRALYARYVAEGRARRCVKAGAIISEAFKTWAQVGIPYVLYKDAINRKSNMRNVAPIASSNLCVAGDTLILTDAGQVPIKDLAGNMATVWNGVEWSRAAVAQTSTGQALVRVCLEGGATLDCTPAHKFYTVGAASGATAPEVVWADQLPTTSVEVPAGNLRAGDVLMCASVWPVVKGGERLRAPYAQGANARAALASGESHLSEVCAVPFSADLESRVEWFAGFCDGDAGAIPAVTDGVLCIKTSVRVADKVRQLLQTMGCDSHVRGALGGLATHGSTIVLTGSDVADLVAVGFRPRNLPELPTRGERRWRLARVQLVCQLPGIYPTYCFNEPLRHRGVFGGILTGQCCEITIPSWSGFDAADFERFHEGNGSGGEFGVCNLAAVCLESFVVDGAGGAPPRVDYAGIADAAGLEARALDRIIDLNFSPSDECRRSNRRHRPIGVGIMGLADVLARLGIAYGSPAAQRVARGIAAAVYYGAATESCHRAEAEGAYETFPGSPISAGMLTPDVWVEAGDLIPDWVAEVEATTGGFLSRGSWDGLRAAARRGIRNAYVTAYMPTATTSNIVGQNECFEPFTSNIYPRKTLAGEFLVVNRHLIRRLMDLGIWDDTLRREILAAGGSVRGIARIPEDVRKLFATAREVHPSFVVRMAKAMAPFVCQSMSMNLFLDEPNLPKIIRFLTEGWKAGLKTGMYYCHTRPAASSQQTSIIVTTGAAPAAAPVAAPAAAPITCTETVCTSCAL